MKDSLVRVGDMVIVKIDKEARSWGQGKDLPEGMTGEVIGRERIRRFYDRKGPGRRWREPGYYERDGSPIVKWENGTTGTVVWHHFDFADPAVYKARIEEHWRNIPTNVSSIQNDDKLDNMVRLGTLPDTAFWEGDIVKIKNWTDDEDGCLVQVTGINWSWIEMEPAVVDGVVYLTGHLAGKELSYDCHWIKPDTHEYARRGSTHVRESNLELIERGNYWKEAHGEPLVFHSLKEEAEFAHASGRDVDVRNPKPDGNYAWTLEEALNGVEAGIIDSLNAGGMFSDRATIYATKFDDPDLGARLRAETLRGFGRA